MNLARSNPGSAIADSRFRFVGFAAMLLLSAAFIAVLVRVAQLQIAPSERLEGYRSVGRSFTVEPAPRGDLLDRRGRPIASTAFGWRVFADPTRLPAPPDAAILELADTLGMDPGELGGRILDRLERNERRRADSRTPIRYVSLTGALDDAQLDAVRRLRIPGVHLERVPVRRVIHTPGLESLVGMVGVEHTGLLGAERAFDELLAASAGTLTTTRDARGRTLWIEVGSYQPPVAGNSVRLSIDLAVQEIAIEELTRGVTDADAAGGRVIVLDPATGEILALADITREIHGAVPFDARLINRDSGRGPRFNVIKPDAIPGGNPAFRRNRVVEDVYEPGSTFKPFMWSAVTELALKSPDDEIETHSGKWRTPYGRPLEDVTPRGRQTWRDVLVNSSNIGMAQGVALMSHRQMRDAVVKLGFGRATGLGLPGEADGIVTSQRDWSKYTQTSVAMGYEVAVTPVQMVRAFSVFARRGELAGTMPGLTLTRDSGDAGFLRRVFPAEVALAARDAMRGVAANMDERMTRIGRFDRPPIYPMFAKSGTANIPRPDGRGYIEGQYISSFIAGAPTEQPRIVVLVVIDDPGPALAEKRQHFGSWTAGPVVRRIVERTLPYLGVEPPAI